MQSDEKAITAELSDQQGIPLTGELSDVDPIVLDQIYTLIDAILPFEACLYYQIFPLLIEGSCLTVGIVDPKDEAATEYVTKQLSYINYSIEFQEISSDWHRDVLSKYLNHSAQQQAGVPLSPAHQATDSAAVEDELLEVASPSVDVADDSVQSLTEATDVTAQTEGGAPVDADSDRAESPETSEAVEAPIAENSPTPPTNTPSSNFLDNRLAEATFILEATEISAHLTSEAIASPSQSELSESANAASSSEPADKSIAPADAVAMDEPSNSASSTLTPPDVSVDDTPSAAAAAAQSDQTTPLASEATAEEPPHPEMDTMYRDVSELLASMPPQTLMRALLDKVTGEGIGRLYLEPRETVGRILWSCNGALEGEIDPIDRQVLQGVIDEFKKLAHLPVVPVVAEPQQAEIERDQQGQKILIRVSITPTDYGEQSTVQILRGKALDFYRDQHLDRLGRDALDVAHKLQQRLGEIRDRARSSIHSQPTRSEVLPQLVNLLKQLGTQVQEIEAAYDEGGAPL